MIGLKLTPEQADDLRGKPLNENTTFNPVPDINGDDYIFEGEVDECTNPLCMWVKDLLPSEYVPPLNTELP